MIICSCAKIIRCFKSAPQTGEELIIDFLFGVVKSYLFGAFSSDFSVIYITAMVATVVFLVSVLVGGETSKEWAKLSVVTIALLSLFCIWIEPWLSLPGVLSGVLLILVGAPTFIVDCCVTIGWAYLVFAANEELDYI